MIRTLPALLLLITVAACGSDGEPGAEQTTPTPSATTPALPVCADVWKDGATLPADYIGCTGEAGTTVGEVETCDNGTDKFATYIIKDAAGDELPYFGLLGGKVFAYTDDEFGPYATAFSKCRAG